MKFKDKEYKFFKPTGIVECPHCGKHIVPERPFEKVYTDSDGDVWGSGICPECNKVAVLIP